MLGKSPKSAATEQSGKKSLASLLLPLAAIVLLLLLVLAISVAMDHLMFVAGRDLLGSDAFPAGERALLGHPVGSRPALR